MCPLTPCLAVSGLGYLTRLSGGYLAEGRLLTLLWLFKGKPWLSGFKSTFPHTVLLWFCSPVWLVPVGLPGMNRGGGCSLVLSGLHKGVGRMGLTGIYGTAC